MIYPTFMTQARWTPDGAEVVFRSLFQNIVGRDPNLFAVSIKGGAPRRFPIERGVLISFSPDGKKFLYNQRLTSII